MNTPKTSGLSLTNSKYLTPCRTTGLKRKSISPLISSKSNLELKLVSVGGTPSPRRTPLKRLSNLIGGVPRKEQDDPPREKKVKTEEIQQDDYKNNEPVESSSHTDLTEVLKEEESPFHGFITKENVVELITKINKNFSKLENLKRSNVYTRMHNIVELKQTTKKWREALRDSAFAIQEELKRKEQDVSLAVILKEHNIPFEDVGFNEEIMDFE